MSEIQLTDQSFDSEVLQSNIPVLVDFWAPWCGPCRMLAPMIAELATEYVVSALKQRIPRRRRHVLTAG